VLQDYVIYPRLIRRAMHLHPIAVGGGHLDRRYHRRHRGVCLAVPTVGVLQVTYRHYREYRAIERLVREYETHRPNHTRYCGRCRGRRP
jgi:hypothetical protein